MCQQSAKATFTVPPDSDLSATTCFCQSSLIASNGILVAFAAAKSMTSAEEPPVVALVALVVTFAEEPVTVALEFDVMVTCPFALFGAGR
jgi:hypothetical protein